METVSYYICFKDEHGRKETWLAPSLESAIRVVRAGEVKNVGAWIEARAGYAKGA